MKQPPPSCRGILGVLVNIGGWTTTSTLLNLGVKTTCIHKRLSELIDLGYAEKTFSIGGKRLYRAIPGLKEVSS